MLHAVDVGLGALLNEEGNKGLGPHSRGWNSRLSPHGAEPKRLPLGKDDPGHPPVSPSLGIMWKVPCALNRARKVIEKRACVGE